MGISKIIKAAAAGVIAKKTIEKATGQKSAVKNRDIVASAISSESVKKTVKKVTNAKPETAKDSKIKNKKSSTTLSTLVGAVKIAHKAGKKTLEKQALNTQSKLPFREPLVLNKHQNEAKNRLDQQANKNEAAVQAHSQNIIQTKDTSEEEGYDIEDGLFTQQEQSLLRD